MATLSTPKRGCDADGSIFRLRGARIIIDTREPPHCAWDFPDLEVERSKLDQGDYSVSGMEHRIAIERKTMDDFISSLTRERDRFTRELDRLKGYERALIVVEAHFDDVCAGAYRSMMRPASIVGSVASIHARFGVPTVFAGDRQNAQFLARVWLLKGAKRLWEQASAA